MLGWGAVREGLKKYSCPSFRRSGNTVQDEMKMVSLDNDPSHKDDVHATIKCVYPLIRFICLLLDLLLSTIIKCCYLTNRFRKSHLESHRWSESATLVSSGKGGGILTYFFLFTSGHEIPSFL